jgi:hypothetical protein
MTTRVTNVGGAIGALLLLFSFESIAVDVPVPSAPDLIAKSDAIFVVECSLREGKLLGKVKEVLKGDSGLISTTVPLSSPYPQMSFPLDQLSKTIEQRTVIVLGKWLEETSGISLIYGNASIWPSGAPADASESKTLAECLSFIRKHTSSENQKELK